MKLPEYPQKGKPVEQTIREMIDYLRMTTITNFQGGQMKQSRGGTTLSVKTPIRPRMNDTRPHPWKIISVTAIVGESEELRLYVNYGQVFQAWLRSWDTFPTTPDAQSQQQTITIGGGSLANHPDGTTAGYLTLAASTTYGIWLKGNYASVGTSTNYFSSPSLGFGYVTVDGYTLFFDSIEAESTYTTPASKPDNGEVWLFLGSVDVDANLVPTIVQWWKSDIVCPSFNIPRIQLSTDTGNSLLIGADGKLFAPPVVSSDANNDITTGSDGGAYYDAP